MIWRGGLPIHASTRANIDEARSLIDHGVHDLVRMAQSGVHLENIVRAWGVEQTASTHHVREVMYKSLKHVNMYAHHPLSPSLHIC